LANYADETKSENEVSYLALDLELGELQRTLGAIAKADLGAHLDGRVSIGGLCGTYDDGIDYIRGGGLLEQRSTSSLSSVATPDDNPSMEAIISLKPGNDNEVSSTYNHDPDVQGRSSPEPMSVASSNSPSLKPEVNSLDVVSPPLHLMFLGSSIGNFHPQDAANFLRTLPLRPWDNSGGDTLLLGLDHDNEPKLVELAYDDPAGHTRRFIMNGLTVLKRTFLESSAVTKESVEVFDPSNWDYSERYNIEEGKPSFMMTNNPVNPLTVIHGYSARHEGRYISKRDQFVQLPDGQKIDFAAGEILQVEFSYKVCVMITVYLISLMRRDGPPARSMSPCFVSHTVLLTRNLPSTRSKQRMICSLRRTSNRYTVGRPQTDYIRSGSCAGHRLSFLFSLLHSKLP